MLKSKSILLTSTLAFLLSLASSCNNSSNSNSAPAVTGTSPLDLSSDVARNAPVRATFSEPMDASTINDVTFTLTTDPAATPVLGTVIYADSVASFWPQAHLASNTTFSATITTGVHDVAGNALRASHVWQFTTGVTLEAGRGVELGRANDFAVLAKAGISTVPASAITGKIGVSPAAATFITGFALTMDPSNQFATSTQVTGNVLAADYAAPTPATLTAAVLNMETAFTDAAGRAPDVTELGAGNVGGLTLVPGVYRWSTGLLIPTDLTLNGSATGVWIFQIAQDLSISSATNVLLVGGALPENVFWQVTGLVDVGTTAQLGGVILCATAVTMQTGSSINGRLLAQTAVSLDTTTVVEP